MSESDHAALLEFKLDYAKTTDLAVGDVVYSENVSTGGHIWRIWCYPRGLKQEDNGEYLSLFLEMVSQSKNVRAVCSAFVMGKEGAPSSSGAAFMKVYPIEGFKIWGWPRFAKRSNLESHYVVNGVVRIICRIMVVRGGDDEEKNPIAVPPSDIGSHLGHLLERGDGADVSFAVGGGETFRAHRAVLAARSPVFRAQLFGCMAEATMHCIALQDIDAAAFRILLRFIYTDVLPSDANSGSSSTTEFFQNLLVAADRYDLGRLKLMCAQKLWESVSVETVSATLGFADMHNCPELKDRCLDFLMVERNFKKAVVTDGYFELRHRFPSIIDEIRRRLED